MTLDGLTILALEDEPIIALVLEDLLEMGGGRACVAETLEEAFALLDAQEIQAAILDVNVQGQESYPVARKLAEQDIPFIFASGYGDARHPPEFASVPTTAKPYNLADLQRAFATLD
jgi:DNA-binding NtrC family response regulator